ncbi:glycosyltransferase family 90 protein [Acrodontium crateriforme]|uniref:Glycosyltransferase family 90 protein n=1 Tax=Acrodontium crateriforme TaxID=150365 RepID=A0AAQ3R9W8_9PEZI|nr:glycosyltransferase family 90 protein [Acrodontium crateriforme]
MTSRFQHDAALRPALIIPTCFFLASVLAYTGTVVRHHLLTSAIAWLLICGYTSLRVGWKSLFRGGPAQKLAWAAGGMLALAQVEEKAADGRGIWWAKALFPLIICAINDTGILNNELTGGKPGSNAQFAVTRTLFILTGSAIAATYVSSIYTGVIAIGLSYAVSTAFALSLIQRAFTDSLHHGKHGETVIYSTNGLLAQPETLTNNVPTNSFLAVIRDVSTAATLCTGLATLVLEGFGFGSVAYWEIRRQWFGEQWVLKHMTLSLGLGVVMIAVHVFMNGLLLLMIHRQDQNGAFLTSFVPLAAVLCSQLVVRFSPSGLWFTGLCTIAAWIYFGDQSMSATNFRAKMRAGRLLTLVAILSFVFFALIPLGPTYSNPETSSPKYNSGSQSPGLPKDKFGPLTWDKPHPHPIDHLFTDAKAAWTATLQSQSQTLEAAVAEYKRRYGIPPPPNFDKWYEFAKRKGTLLIDEYDTIYHSLLPFWALEPSTIRARVKEALGFDNALIALLIRNGEPVTVRGGQDWQQEATIGMMEKFVEHLPDMDLAFNIHDECRVVVPHDELSRLVQIALLDKLPAALANRNPRNSFSSRPKDLGDGKRIKEVKTTRFNVFAHQPVWIPSRLSCPMDSPARAIEDQSADNFTSYAMSDLGFVYNHTAFSDVCNSPSFATSHGFFDRPNAFNVIHELFPIFSQSKMSSFQDILYPSPWYWFGKVKYDETKDTDWNNKTNSLYWRGSTTGGYSREGGWRRQHRQQVVRTLNALDTAKIYKNANQDKPDLAPEWKVDDVRRQDFQELIDVHFSHVGQCDDGDCDAQKEFFKIAEPADQQDAWKYRYLLDLDGNAFSGRFYAFLESHSVTLKMSVFREWHEEWIKPWIHYIPLSLRAEEGLEVVRYMSAEEEGRQHATRMAEASRDWARKTLRNEDFEVWFFRLLLEYGRIIDDNRASIGYSG